MSRVREKLFEAGPVFGGLAFFPYQLAMGLSVRWWPCIFTPSIRLYIGPFKLWVCTIYAKPEPE